VQRQETWRRGRGGASRLHGHVARAQGLAGGELDEEAPGGDMRASGRRQRYMGLYLRAEQR